MPSWTTLLIGLLVLGCGIAVLVQGSQQIISIIQLVVAGLLIMLGIRQMIKRKSPRQKTSAETPSEPQEEPPAF